jgi:hypothetical protein
MRSLDNLLDERLGRANAPKLADPTPPVEPPSFLPYARPTPHRLVAWRHDNGLEDTRHDSLELARERARELHWAVYWKYAIMAGRDMVERQLIEED